MVGLNPTISGRLGAYLRVMRFSGRRFAAPENDDAPYRSISRFQRLVHSSRLALAMSQSTAFSALT